MKPKFLTLIFALAGLLLVGGCGDDSEVEEAADEVGDAVEEAADEVEDATE